jgi:hypothetical protein
MSESERQEIKAKLIENGFWGADEPGDPTTDLHDAGTLHDRMEARLAEGVYLTSEIASDHAPAREAVIFCGDPPSKLAGASTYAEAISLAALALPEFLSQHPDCDALASNQSAAKKATKR